MDFVPRRLPGLIIGAGISVGMLALSAVFLWRLHDNPVSIESFVLGVAGAATVVSAAFFIFWTFSCWRLKYAIDKATLVIRWGPIRNIVPLNLVERTFSGAEVEKTPKIRGLNWPGHHVGSASVGSLDRVVFFSAHVSPRELVYVVTPGIAYAISPQNPSAFLDRLNKTKEKFSPPAVRPMAVRWSILRLPFWRDRAAQTIILIAFLINVSLFAYVAYFYPSLPELLPLHFTVFGDVDLIGYRTEVLKLPVMALVVLAFNLAFGLALHSKEKVGSYITLVTAAFVQVVFWVATVRIVY
ncbi:MAG: PH domain-containing protein [Dehalococcoidia bacterium]|nr:PH domain-containing protein [Dehalococcoidia bacterium]